MKDQPSTRLAAMSAPRSSVCSLWATRSDVPAPAAMPATPIPTSARLRLLIHDPAESLAGEFALRNEAVRAAALDERAKIRSVVARRQDDGRGRAVGLEALRD